MTGTGAKVAFEKLFTIILTILLPHLYYGNVLLTGNIEAGINETKKHLRWIRFPRFLNMVLEGIIILHETMTRLLPKFKTVALNPRFPSAYVVLVKFIFAEKLYSQAIGAFSKLPPGMFDVGSAGDGWP